jgi:hypothetical protein
MVMIYTYVLKDVDNDIFKIGKTSVPQTRFNKLCIKDRIYPIALYTGDFEKELHKEFKENRVDHPDKSMGGYTEFFKRGGKFDAFLSDIEEVEVPYCRVTDLIKEMMELGKVQLSDPFILWDISNDKFGWYSIGKIVLEGLGKIKDGGYGNITVYSKEVSYIEHKLAITARLYDDILLDEDIHIKIYEDMDNLVINVDDFIKEYKVDDKVLYVVVSI